MIDKFIQGFLLHREAEGRSRKTLEWHQSSLTLFAQWIKETNQSDDPNEWTATTIRSYFVHLRERLSKNGTKLSASSIRTYASSVLAFCRWLHDEELTDKNVAARVTSPKTPHLVKEPFERDELKRLLASAKSDRRNGLRDHALLLFLLDTGCRANEVVTLKSTDILWNQRLAKVYGKGSKERIVFFSAETAKVMLKYQMRCSQSDHFFSSEEGKPLTTSGLLQIMKRLGNRSNVDDTHPHRFRHTFAITFLRSGGNVLALQRILGHSTLTMTQRYVALVSDDLQREHVLHSPVSFLLK